MTKIEGSKIRLLCKGSLSANGTVQWFKNRRKINSKNSRYVFKNRGRKLVLRNLTKGDTGNYMCRDSRTRKKVKIFRLVVKGLCS